MTIRKESSHRSKRFVFYKVGIRNQDLKVCEEANTVLILFQENRGFLADLQSILLFIGYRTGIRVNDVYGRLVESQPKAEKAEFDKRIAALKKEVKDFEAEIAELTLNMTLRNEEVGRDLEEMTAANKEEVMKVLASWIRKAGDSDQEQISTCDDPENCVKFEVTLVEGEECLESSEKPDTQEDTNSTSHDESLHRRCEKILISIT